VNGTEHQANPPFSNGSWKRVKNCRTNPQDGSTFTGQRRLGRPGVKQGDIGGYFNEDI
jgi:hypothetical protein